MGIGMEQNHVWDDRKKKWRCRNRPRQCSNDPRFARCHAVIIEDLSHYRPEETRTRRENRATMDWKSAETRKRLADHCQLYGIHLRDVNPQYTSRQDSRTGLPGVRCVDIAVDSRTGEPKAYWWIKLSSAKKKTGDQDDAGAKGDAESRFIVELAAHLADLKANGEPLPNFVRVPRKGGDLVVTATPLSCKAKDHKPCPLCDGKRRALQADLTPLRTSDFAPCSIPTFQASGGTYRAVSRMACRTPIRSRARPVLVTMQPSLVLSANRASPMRNWLDEPAR